MLNGQVGDRRLPGSRGNRNDSARLRPWKRSGGIVEGGGPEQGLPRASSLEKPRVRLRLPWGGRKVPDGACPRLGESGMQYSGEVLRSGVGADWHVLLAQAELIG